MKIDRLGAKVNKKTVLVVEDEVCCREALRLMLEFCGCKVLLTNACEEAFALLRVKSQHIDLILLDIMMPDRTGIDFLIKARAEEILDDIPVVIQSAESSTTIQKALDHGACGYIHKPYVKSEIFRLVKNLVKPNRFSFLTETMVCN